MYHLLELKAIVHLPNSQVHFRVQVCPTNGGTGWGSNEVEVLAARAGACLVHMVSLQEPCLQFLCHKTSEVRFYSLIAKIATPPLASQTVLWESELYKYEKGPLLCFSLFLMK